MNIFISYSAPDPIYQQISRQIKNQIAGGTLAEGAPLPSIRGLARDLRISVITTKRAYEELEREGFINTVTGKGSFVANRNRDFFLKKQKKAIESTLTEIIKQGRLAGIELDEMQAMVRRLYGQGTGPKQKNGG